jgi:ABC-2 type transport system permease protein
MNLKQSSIALYTLIRREMKRLTRIWIQALLGPITNIFLYFLIFGNIIGQRIGSIHNVPYLEFIAPGLIIISVINTSYAHVTSSIFVVRFQRNIEEMIVTPMSNLTILMGFIFSGMIRGLLVAGVITSIIMLFFKVPLHLNIYTFMDIFATSALFALLGFLNGLVAKDFDELAFVPSFILTPLGYLGGVFYDINMLSQPWLNISKFNPLWYIIQSFRAHTLDQFDALATQTSCILISMISILLIVNLLLMKRSLLLKPS